MASPTAVRLSIGDCILVQIGNGPGKEGIALIKYIGFIHGYGMREYIGVELLHKVDHGHNGTINGYQYFTAAKGYGIHIKLSHVIRKLTASELFLKFKNDFAVIQRKLKETSNTGKQKEKFLIHSRMKDYVNPSFEPGRHLISKTSRRTSGSLSRSITRITTDASPMPTPLDMENLCSLAHLRPSLSLRSKNEKKRKSQLPIIQDQDDIYDHLPLTPNEVSNYSISEYLNDASSLCQTNTTHSSLISTASSRSHSRRSSYSHDNTSPRSSISRSRHSRKKKKAHKKHHKKRSSYSDHSNSNSNGTTNANYKHPQQCDISNLSTKQTSSPVVRRNNSVLMSFHQPDIHKMLTNTNHNNNNNNNNNLLVRQELASSKFAQYNPLTTFPDLNYGNHLIAQGLVYQSSPVPSVRMSQSHSHHSPNGMPSLSQHQSNSHSALPSLSQHPSNSHQSLQDVSSLRCYFDADAFYKQQQHQLMARKCSSSQTLQNSYYAQPAPQNYSPQSAPLHQSPHHSPHPNMHQIPQPMYSLSVGNHVYVHPNVPQTNVNRPLQLEH